MLEERIKRAFLSPLYPLWLLVAFGVWFAVWAIKPPHFSDFILEHVLTAVFVPFICWSYRWFRLSNVSYTTIFLFVCLHVVGAHYTYAEVPYQAWLQTAASWVGISPDRLPDWMTSGRNQYDRLVHFAFGLLIAYPVREVFLRIARVKGFWGYYLPLDVVMSLSMLYELVEWGVAVVFGGDLGQSYLGTQGDEWDAHKDMALASLGGLIAMLAAASINWRYQRDFAKEFAASLTVDSAEPLGEVRMREYTTPASPATPNTIDEGNRGSHG